MNRTFLITFASVVSITWSALTFAQPASPLMPLVSAETLNERAVSLPADLPGEKTLVLMAFEREQQKQIDTWITGLQLQDNTQIEWIETPVIEPKNALFRAFINRGMRSGIKATPMRERTITLFTDRAALLKSMGLNDGTNTIYAAVVDRKGNVLASVSGAFDDEKAKVIKAGLAPN